MSDEVEESVAEGGTENDNEESERPGEEDEAVENKESEAKLTLAESVAVRLKEQPSMMSRASRISRARKRREARLKCVGREPWNCEDEPLWRIYMKTYAEDLKLREEYDADKYGEYFKRKPAKDAPRWPGVCPSRGPLCQKLNAFNTRQLDVLPSTRIWDKMHSDATSISTASSCSSEIDWPKLYPCSKRDIVRERKILARKAKMKRMGALPCKIDEVDSPESSDDERLREMANLKELGHAIIPRTSPMQRELVLIDRACGDKPGLVEGDYVLYELKSKRGSATYANICLRGTRAMHLAELGRVRERTWKFDLYQAVVALLAKTQFRYKYVWSANIDYIYEHAWMLFVHMGYINAMKNQRFDDVLVYNYKYSVELELLDELKDVKADPSVGFQFFERTLHKQSRHARKELTLLKSGFGNERHQDGCPFKLFVHKSTRAIEKWFDKLDAQRTTNCIYRTTRFSLAFWQDGPFWYLYNPYSCDKYGFWENAGAACIVKFSTRQALKRHLMILTVRAYAYDEEMRMLNKNNQPADDNESEESSDEERFTIQVYQLIYHDCQIHNVKLYKRKPWRPRPPLVEKKRSDPCTFDPLEHLAPRICGEDSDDELNGKIEKPKWLRDSKITWSKNISDADECKKESEGRSKWHSFDVIEPRRLYVLFGELHVSDKMFAKDNHFRQAGACYAVCAGMTLINAPEYWSPDVLKAIVVCGDNFFSKRKLKLKHQKDVLPESWDVLSTDSFLIGDIHFDIKVHAAVHGHLFSRDRSLWSTLERIFAQQHRFAILSCESSCLGVFKHCGAYYALDVLSYGPPVYVQARGGAYLLRAACLSDMVKCLVMIIGTPECRRFELRCVEVLKVKDLEKEDECAEKRKEASKCSQEAGIVRPKCPLEEERKKAKRRGRREEDKKLIDVVICPKKDSR